MKCSRCQTELPDTATLCPTCGQTTNQPGQVVTFSYLPAGTPPWPTAVPQRLPYVVDAAPAPDKAAQLPTKQASGRSVRGILALIAVLILTPVIGAALTFAVISANGGSSSAANANSSSTQTGAQPGTQANTIPGSTATVTPATAQPTTAATPQGTVQPSGTPSAGGFTATKDSGINMSFRYPSNWVAQPRQITQGNAYDIAPNDQASETAFSIVRLSESVSSTIPSADVLNTSNITSLSGLQGVHNLQKIQSNGQQSSIGGTKWIQQEAVFMDDNSQKIHFTTIAVQHNKSYYTIYYNSPDANYNDSLQKYFSPILTSIQFLS